MALTKQEKREARQREQKLKKQLEDTTKSRDDLRKRIDECEKPLKTKIEQLEIHEKRHVHEQFEILKILDESGFPALGEAASAAAQAVQKLADAYKELKGELGEEEEIEEMLCPECDKGVLEKTDDEFTPFLCPRCKSKFSRKLLIALIKDGKAKFVEKKEQEVEEDAKKDD